MVGKLRWLIAVAAIAVGLVLVAHLVATGIKKDRSEASTEPSADAAPIQASSTAAEGDSRSSSTAYSTRQITLTASRYAFTPSQVLVNEADTVQLVLSSRDVIHRFQLLDFGVDITISPGTRRTVDVQADRPGIYRFFWADLDGANPSQMAGVFIVQARPD
jgi:cytochrome c oxidase subunit 2